ncbi:MAG: hypothetical protein HFG00_05830 [Oscillibacter sp.]|nr:hypothetical protein [Oscillibacter sp.]
MLRIEPASWHRGFAESRQLMWACARQAKVSYFQLLCQEKALYAIYDEDVFCGCAVQHTLKGAAGVLCFFSKAVYCGQSRRSAVTELLAEALDMEPDRMDFVYLEETFHPSGLRISGAG